MPPRSTFLATAPLPLFGQEGTFLLICENALAPDEDAAVKKRSSASDSIIGQTLLTAVFMLLKRVGMDGSIGRKHFSCQ